MTKLKQYSKIILWNVVIFLILAVVLEYILYIKGFNPGMIENGYYFNKVDELIIKKGYQTDSTGITKIDSSMRDIIHQKISDKEYANYLNIDNTKDERYLYKLSDHFLDVIQGNINNDFSHFIDSISHLELKNNIDSTYLEYIHYPINEDGFRSIPFKNHKTDKIKVLLLGDSFTWGHSAVSTPYSFAEVLSSLGYVVYNSGITATDPPQYVRIAEQYAPIIQPDIIIGNIYMGNDIVKWHREPQAYQAVFYNTNAGHLMSDASGTTFKSAQEVYDHYIRLTHIPPHSTFNRMMSKTRVSTLTWAVLGKYRILGIGPWPNDYSIQFWKGESEKWARNGQTYNRIYQEQLDSIGRANEAIYISSIIPQNHKLDISDTELDSLFDGYSDYHINREFIPSDYQTGYDGHFNNQGHRNYALYLDKLIQNHLSE